VTDPGSGGAQPGCPEGSSRIAGLHVLVDDDARWGRDPVQQARAACMGGARVVQLRAKVATDRQVLGWAAAIRGLTRRHGVMFLVNDRFDLALAAGADGVHLGQDDLPPDRLPPEARSQLVVGRSTHTPEQIATARQERVDYVAFGPVFTTGSKESAFRERGLDALAQAVRLALPLPLVAIGGIDRERAPAVVATGAAGIAVIAAVAGAAEPEAMTRELSGVFGASGT
jgi:thiamine-phosphate pyrophosphorylase